MIVRIAEASDPRDRLDKLVVLACEAAGVSVSRATAQRWIANDRVRVEDATGSDAAPRGRPGPAPLRASTRVAIGARVEVSPEPAAPSRAAPDASIPLTIVFEDEHLAVIDKPAGLVVHPARGHAGGTLVNALLGHALVAATTGAAEKECDPMATLRPGIVHRIDKGTSGLLVVAKTEAAREGLKALFHAHDIDREYAAIVWGTPREGTVDSMHGRHPTDRLRFTSRVPVGRRAVTHVAIAERIGVATLVRCRLDTGRTHQIRVHLAEVLGTPVIGDPIYGRPPRDPKLRALDALVDHQALHAALLGFVHPITGQRLRFESALPPDVARLLDALRAEAALMKPHARRSKKS